MIKSLRTLIKKWSSPEICLSCHWSGSGELIIKTNKSKYQGFQDSWRNTETRQKVNSRQSKMFQAIFETESWKRKKKTRVTLTGRPTCRDQARVATCRIRIPEESRVMDSTI